MNSQHEISIAAEPYQLFQQWYDEAKKGAEGVNKHEPDAVALATSTSDGKPSLRFVLFKGITRQLFVFHTNYDSRKGKELLANPHAALAFHWSVPERQVRIEGSVSKLTDAESLAYWNSRPFESQISALASSQSEAIVSRESLEKRVQELREKYRKKGTAPRPPHWGGFGISPERIEFWEARSNRLHDRVSYMKSGSGWKAARLSP